MRNATWFYIHRGIIIVPAKLYRSARTAIKNAADLERSLQLRSIVLPDLRPARGRSKPAT